ncbi:hypothetical protein UA08_02503 [Talaromyces atroroseus]|uniref:Uncharacterized protein n=1 Tax=Talaromyces atroroseus TaxID=1441469 RepID=A0A225B3K2_TALAT|nr:hypothetical protein UA08_02503 [Talaromyces atroroseus]OKL61866.1 hypothetical protein UA08_02503 [Talaromyces atroroseus]
MNDYLALTPDLDDMWDLHGSMRQHLEGIEEQICGLKNGTEDLMQENMQLKNELVSFRRKEKLLQSVLTKIEAEAQQMATGDDAMDDDIYMIGGSQKAATEISAHHEAVSFLTKFFQENVRLNEKARRQGELLAQANREASESATQN